jgi:hypothetical protein
MMAALDTFIEAHGCEKRSQIVKTNIGVGCSMQDLSQDAFPHHNSMDHPHGRSARM